METDFPDMEDTQKVEGSELDAVAKNLSSSFEKVLDVDLPSPPQVGLQKHVQCLDRWVSCCVFVCIGMQVCVCLCVLVCFHMWLCR